MTVFTASRPSVVRRMLEADRSATAIFGLELAFFCARACLMWNLMGLPVFCFGLAVVEGLPVSFLSDVWAALAPRVIGGWTCQRLRAPALARTSPDASLSLIFTCPDPSKGCSPWKLGLLQNYDPNIQSLQKDQRDQRNTTR